jgi:gliding motility-associated-like protein
MKKRLLVLILLLTSTLTHATHIVGGELEWRTLPVGSQGTHQLTLNLYFDDINGNPQAEDPTVLVSFFRKRDNVRIGDIEMPRVSNELIPYTNPRCLGTVIGGLRTRLIRYSSALNVDPAGFEDPQGYYVVWERCCRNNIINNIVNPAGAGTVFYLEFPPLRQSGQPLRNSSPQFRPVVGDYLCLNQPFTLDFGATDPDGDSLRYTLVTPLNGYSNASFPRPFAQGSSSYPTVTWGSGFSAVAAIPGTPALRINGRTGQLQVTPSQLGLFVFSVQVEEFRGGRRIGLVRRDFQLKVIDCPQNAPPRVHLREAGKVPFYQASETIRLRAGTEKCLTFLMTDRDVAQRLTFTTRALTPGPPLGLTLSPAAAVMQSSSDTARVQLCLGACAQSFDGQPLRFQVIVSDDGCPVPQRDTLTVSLYIEPDPNQAPDILTTLANGAAQVPIGTPLRFDVRGTDADPDSIRIEARGRGFALPAAGMQFTGSAGLGTAAGPFAWTPTCAQVRTEPYLVDFVVTETRCGQTRRDSVTVSLAALPRASRPPTVATNLPLNGTTITLDPLNPQPIQFDVLGTDPDADPITLIGQGRGFTLTSAGMQFQDRSGTGRVESPFAWVPGCALLDGQSERIFTVDFLVEDNSCQPNRFDTVSVELRLQDRVANYEVAPPNVFTPNDDGKNDTFRMPDLPIDNCAERFERVEVYNRWGQRVFSDTRRDFAWAGTSFPTGQYFYYVKFTKRVYKGSLTLLR